VPHKPEALGSTIGRSLALSWVNRSNLAALRVLLLWPGGEIEAGWQPPISPIVVLIFGPAAWYNPLSPTTTCGAESATRSSTLEAH
jgi:hypothetical protein